MFTHRLFVVVVVVVVRLSCLFFFAPLLASCIDSPLFNTTVEPSGSAVATNDMALVPPTTVSSSVSPTGHGKNDEKGDEQDDKGGGKGKPEGAGGGGGSGGPPPPTPPNAPPAPPTAPAPGVVEVVVPSFWIDLREVSARDYAACVSAGACAASGTGKECTSSTSELETHPANCVTRAQAITYCTWRGKRLLKFDEWSAASSSGARRRYPWGEDAPSADRLNACGNECKKGAGMYGGDGADPFATTAPCGSFPGGSSVDGVFDLAGNVAEWVDVDDPSKVGVVRGGSYADVDANAASSSSTRYVAPDVKEPTIGFRCARAPNQ